MFDLLAERASLRQSRWAFAVTVQVWITQTSQVSPKGTTSHPEALNEAAIVAVSAWLSLHPTVLNETRLILQMTMAPVPAF
jgi:hypothetical protein